MHHGQMPGSTISARQLEVLLAGGRGLSDQQVAQELFLSVHTVKRHKEDAYKRLGVHGLAEAIYKLAQEGNLSLADKPKSVPHPVEPHRSRVLQATATAHPLPATAQTYVDVFSVAMNPATPPAIRRSAGRYLHRAAADWGHGGHQVMLPIPIADMPAPAHRSFRDLIRAAIEHRIYGDETPAGRAGGPQLPSCVSRSIANADELDHAEEALDQLAADFGGEFDGHDC